MGEPCSGTRARESRVAESLVVVRNVNKVSADTAGALSSLINPSDPQPKIKAEKSAFTFQSGVEGI